MESRIWKCTKLKKSYWKYQNNFSSLHHAYISTAIGLSEENMKHVNSPGFIKKCNNATWFLDIEK
jgi:hypothetical protein